MGKHYKLKDDKLTYLLKIWCEDHNVKLSRAEMHPYGEAPKLFYDGILSGCKDSK